MSVKCPECGFDKEFSSNYCKKCGFVFDDCPFEKNPFIPNNVKRSASLPEFSVAGSMPIQGKVVKDYWLRTTKEKNTFNVKKQIENMASRLNIPQSVEKEAYIMFKRAVEQNLNLGRNNIHIAYACVYASCIIHNIPKTPLEMVAFTGVDKHKMLRAYRMLKLKLNLKVEPIDMLDFVPRFCLKLKLKPTTTSLVSEILIKLRGSSVIVGKQPKTIVASAIYLATKMNNDYRTQRDIANSTGVLEVTIRKMSNELHLYNIKINQ